MNHKIFYDNGRRSGHRHMSIGVFIASQLAWPSLNFDTPWLTFSRLRPLHTNAVIFAFGACFATSYYIVQRTCLRQGCSHLIWPGLPFGVGKQLSYQLCLPCPWVSLQPKSYINLSGQ